MVKSVKHRVSHDTGRRPRIFTAHFVWWVWYALTNAGMSERSITDRVRVFGEQVGVEGFGAHDCRHHWAHKVDVLRVQEAGG